MKPIIITATLSLLIGFTLGYFQKVRETDAYIHVVQVNGTLIEGAFQSLGAEDLNALNDLIFETKGADHKILQIMVHTPDKVTMAIGKSDQDQPHPNFTSKIPMTAEKKDGVWIITQSGLATVY